VKLVGSCWLRVDSQRRSASGPINNPLKTINLFKSQEPEYLSGPPHSVAVALLATTKRGEGGCATPARLTEMRLQQNFFAKRRMRAGRCDASKTFEA
jgi:hypothetical protein